MRYAFGDFEFDAEQDALFRGGVRLRARPKVRALLIHLLRHRGRLVYKRELLEKLWPDVAVGATSLSTLLAETRALLGDSGQRQAWIRTEAGRGYRFAAPVRIHLAPTDRDRSRALHESELMDARCDVLARFEDALNQLSRGERRPLAIEGEAQSGKSGLVAELVAMARGRGFVAAPGRCVGASDDTLLRPWIEVLRSLLEGIEERQLPPLLAPDLFALARCDPAYMQWLSPEGRGACAQIRFRILDSVCRFLEARSREKPCVVILEELQWADAASLSLLDRLLGSRGPGALMVAWTRRPADPLAPWSDAALAGRIHATPGLERIALAPIRRRSPSARPLAAPAAERGVARDGAARSVIAPGQRLCS